MFCTGAGAVASDVILAPPAHPLIATAFEMSLAACLRGERDHRWVKTGPGLLTRAVAQRLIEDTPPTAPVPLMALQTLQARVHRWRGE